MNTSCPARNGQQSRADCCRGVRQRTSRMSRFDELIAPGAVPVLRAVRGPCRMSPARLRVGDNALLSELGCGAFCRSRRTPRRQPMRQLRSGQQSVEGQRATGNDSKVYYYHTVTRATTCMCRRDCAGCTCADIQSMVLCAYNSLTRKTLAFSEVPPGGERPSQL